MDDAGNRTHTPTLGYFRLKSRKLKMTLFLRSIFDSNDGINNPVLSALASIHSLKKIADSTKS